MYTGGSHGIGLATAKAFIAQGAVVIIAGRSDESIIRVNTICPGVVDTNMARAGFAIDDDEEAGVARQRQQYPLKRVTTTAKIASAMLYLSSEDARLITGKSLVMDGDVTVSKQLAFRNLLRE